MATTIPGLPEPRHRHHVHQHRQRAAAFRSVCCLVQQAMIKVMGPAFASFGIATKIALAEGLDARNTWDYVSFMQNDAAVWPHIGLLNWHLYGNNDPFRSQIRDFGRARGHPDRADRTPGCDQRPRGRSRQRRRFGLDEVSHCQPRRWRRRRHGRELFRDELRQDLVRTQPGVLEIPPVPALRASRLGQNRGDVERRVRAPVCVRPRGKTCCRAHQ